MSDIVTLARRHKHVAPTHYEGCEVDHIGCLVNRLADEIEGLRAQLEERYVSMRVRQLEEALDAERQTTRRLREALKQFCCSCDPGECVEYGERWASVCEKGEARDVLEGKP